MNPSTRWDCLCVGLAVADHICRPISHLPKAGELVLAEKLELATGGCAANAAVDLARLGVNVGIVARVGDDIFGEFVRREMQRQSVETSGLITTPDYETSGTLIVNVKREDRRFIHCFGANAALDGSELTTHELRDTRVLYLGGYFAAPKLTPGAVVRWFEQCRSAGVATLLDVVIPGPGDYAAPLKTILPHTDVFLPNTDEAKVMTGFDAPLDQARCFRDWGAKSVIITCGGEGTVVLTQTEQFRAGVFHVEHIDGTGSGDAFDAGFIYGLLQGGDLRRCVELGSALGASAVRKIGATAGVFTPDELDDFLARNQLTFEPISA
ncbi:MAG: carbohydrate kinase family protein [Planctomycetales bacterium]